MKKKRPLNKPPKDDEKRVQKQRQALAAERRPGQLPREVLETNQHLPQPVNHQQLLQMQQAHGNNYVQAFLTRMAQKQKFEEREEEEKRLRSPESSAKLAEHNAYEMETEATISDRGVLELDIVRMLDMKRYSQLAQAYRHAIKEWKGSGSVDLMGEPFQDNQMKLEGDGALNFDLGKNFVQSLERVQDPKHQHETPEMGYGLPFKARVRATLHYNSQDPKLREVDVDKTHRQNLQEAEFHKGLYLKLEIESVYRYRVGGQQEEKELGAIAVLAAEMR